MSNTLITYCVHSQTEKEKKLKPKYNLNIFIFLENFCTLSESSNENLKKIK